MEFKTLNLRGILSFSSGMIFFNTPSLITVLGNAAETLLPT